MRTGSLFGFALILQGFSEVRHVFSEDRGPTTPTNRHVHHPVQMCPLKSLCTDSGSASVELSEYCSFTSVF